MFDLGTCLFSLGCCKTCSISSVAPLNVFPIVDLTGSEIVSKTCYTMCGLSFDRIEMHHIAVGAQRFSMTLNEWLKRSYSNLCLNKFDSEV